jgi:hypothetical protein
VTSISLPEPIARFPRARAYLMPRARLPAVQQTVGINI